MTSPLVSIICTTYNHAPYIRQCLDGFVVQKTNFPIEVIIHDDASTDGTVDVIREYEQKYTEIIKPIYQTENQYSQGINIGVKFVFPRIRGKYMALCEGDDYWIDKHKLQKQVDFLEANGDFSLCFHPVKVYNENKRKYIKNNTVPDVPDITDIKTLATGNYINTPSVMYRIDKKVFVELDNFPVLPVADYLFHILFAKNGKIKKLPDIMAVYRIHKSSGWSTKPLDHIYPIWLKLLEALLHYFSHDNEIYNILKEQYIKIASSLLNLYITNSDFDSKRELCKEVENQLQEDSILIFIKLINNLNKEINSLKKSKSYRLGRMFLKPIIAIKHLY